MKKLGKKWKRLISVFGLGLTIAFLSTLLVLHVGFPSKYSDLIISTSKKYDVDDSLVRAIIWTESKYKKDAKSNMGAVGLMQLLPSTAQYIANEAGISDFGTQMLYDEAINIELGTCYLKYLFKKFNDETTVLMAYNAGEGNVLEWREKGITSIPFKETSEYVKRVRLVKKIYNFKGR